MTTSRAHIASLILNALEDHKDQIKRQFIDTRQEIAYFVIDDLLPVSMAEAIYQNFPEAHNTKLKKNLRERKYVAYQMNQYAPLLEEVIYAFQDERVVQRISEICELKDLEADEHLYAGGLSLMGHGHFLNPHLDNSHDKDRERWRVLNLLYYVSPNWNDSFGGQLELWPQGVAGRPQPISNRFNRLVVMATHRGSWHSVRQITTVEPLRCCVSNYYFSKNPIDHDARFHVTSFRGRPSDKIKDLLLRTDTKLRGLMRKVFRKGVRENPHRYKQ